MSEATLFVSGVLYGLKSPLWGIDCWGCLGYDSEVLHFLSWSPSPATHTQVSKTALIATAPESTRPLVALLPCAVTLLHLLQEIISWHVASGLLCPLLSGVRHGPQNLQKENPHEPGKPPLFPSPKIHQ